MPLIAACAAALAVAIAPAARADEPLLALLPPGQLASLRVPDGSALLDSRLAGAVRALIEEHGDADALRAAAGAVRFATGAEPDDLLRALVGDEVVVGVYAPRGKGARGKSRRVVAIARTADAADLERLYGAVTGFLSSRGRADVRRDERRGVPFATIDERLTLSASGDLLVVGSDERLVTGVLDALSPGGAPDGASVASAPDIGIAPATETASPLLAFELDTTLLRARDARALTPDAGPFGRRFTNPLANLLFAGLSAGAGTVRGALHERGGRAELVVDLPSRLADAPAPYAPPAEAAVELPTDEQTAAVLLLRRDLAGWWRQRETLMDEELQPRLARFDQTLGLLFMGGSPAEDVFSGVGTDLALVVDRLSFEPDAPPDVRFPGACLVARVHDPAAFATGMQVAFQSLIGIANTERGKDGKAPFLLESGSADGVPLRCARLVSAEGTIGGATGGASPASGGMAGGVSERDAERALSPTLAFVDDLMLLGTSEEQVRRLLAAWRDGRRVTLRGNTELRLDAEVIARLVADNRGPLVAKSMLDDGLSPEQAAVRIDGLHEILSGLGRLELRLEDGPDGARALLAVELREPGR